MKKLDEAWEMALRAMERYSISHRDRRAFCNQTVREAYQKGSEQK